MITTQNTWLEQWFDKTDAAKNGKVIRRSAHDVDQYSSIEEVVEEARSRSWHVIETGDQVVVLCNSGELRVHC